VTEEGVWRWEMPMETLYGTLSEVLSMLFAKVLSPNSVNVRNMFLLILGISTGKKFQAETFAKSVLSKNKEVFDKLADK
jgi:hypothetical protein